jgi:hypothetical protein
VKDFFFYHAINRHNITTLTPSYLSENYCPQYKRENSSVDSKFRPYAGGAED